MQTDYEARVGEREATREDAELLSLILNWDKAVTAYERPIEGQDRGDLGGEIASLEGRIVRCEPQSKAGIEMMLHIAHRIATAYDLSPDCYVGAGPVVQLLRRLKEATR